MLAPPKSYPRRSDKVISDLTDNLLLRDLKRRALREYGPHFNGFTVLEQGVAFGYLNRFFKAVCLNNPVTCDRLLSQAAMQAASSVCS
jgi:hypothetical protein